MWMQTRVLALTLSWVLIQTTDGIAQEVYSPNYVPAWNDTYIMRHKGSESGKSPRFRTDKEAVGSRDQLMTRYHRMLAPEYKRRVKRDGRASADRWLAATARELGRRDARKRRW